MNSHLAALAAALGFAIGDLVSAVDDVLSFIAVVTAACTGAARYTAVLATADHMRIERATAIGFFAGLVTSVVLLLVGRF